MTANEDLHCARGWLNRASDVLTGAEDYLSALEYAHAAAVIGNGFVNLAHATRALEAMGQASEVAARQLVAFVAIADAADRTGDPTLEAAAEREARAEAEARPHDDEQTEAGHVWMPYPDEPGRRCVCSIEHDHDEDPEDGPDQAQETRAAADWPAEPVDTRYDEQAADRG